MTQHIGTVREKPLHASLKLWYQRPGDHVELAVDGFVIDLVRDDLLIEIQTRGFASLKQKALTLTDLGRRLRIVHPIPADKWIVKADSDGEIFSRRRSPKHGSAIDLFAELVSFPHLLAHPNFEIEVITTVEEEYRVHTPGHAWRRKGWTVVERRLVEVVDTLLIGGTDDLLALLPPGLPSRFTTADLAAALGRPRRLAQQMAFCLRETGVLTTDGKRGKSIQYQVG